MDIDIAYSDNVRSLYDKMTKVALRQLGEFLPKLQNNNFKRIPQDDSQANYWRKRTKIDGTIDFRMSSSAIYNMVRALTRPYPGAHILYKAKEIKVWEAQEIENVRKNDEYGKILGIVNNKIIVKCFDKAIMLTSHEFKRLPEIGEYLQ